MNEHGECVWAEAPWELSMDPFTDELAPHLAPPPLRATHLCPVESQFHLSQRSHRRESAIAIQALWRGYKSRKVMQQVKHAESVWAPLDESYRLCVLCQNLAVVLHHGDSSWDPTESPWYIWMLTQGRHIEALEDYLFERGWVRPPEEPLNNDKAKSAIREVYRLYKRGYYAPGPSVNPWLRLWA